MRPFSYHRPTDLAQAAALLESGDDVAALAGGHTLLPAIKSRLRAPDGLVDLSAIPGLAGIREDGDRLLVGAMTRHADVATSPQVAAHCRALARLAGGIGDPQVRNRGTLGGSIANNDPAADYPAAVLGLAATVHTSQRRIEADDFFQGMFTTALEPGELVTAVAFPRPLAAGYGRFAHPASRYALVGVFVARFAAGVRVAVTGAGAGVFRWMAAENCLSGSFDLGSVAGLVPDEADMNGDIHASAPYRAHLCSVMLGRALADCAASS
ncbi:FAD binding domain-containing protein [Parapedomonas caeni]